MYEAGTYNLEKSDGTETIWLDGSSSLSVLILELATRIAARSDRPPVTEYRIVKGSRIVLTLRL